MSPAINQYITIQNLVPTNKFEHQLLGEQQKHIKDVAAQSSLASYAAFQNGKPLIQIKDGTMGSGKSTAGKLEILTAAKFMPNGMVFSYALQDNRVAEGDNDFYTRNNIPVGNVVHVRKFGFGEGARKIINDIQSGEIPRGSFMSASEIQFGGSKADLEELCTVVRENDIIFTADCLASWFTGLPVEQTVHLKSLADNTHTLWACDTFHQGQKATMPMRCVKIASDGTLIDPQDHTTSPFYMNLNQEQRRDVFCNLEKANGQFCNKLIREQDGQVFALAPSDVGDAGYKPGSDEDGTYNPTTINTCIAIANSTGLPALAQGYINLHEEGL